MKILKLILIFTVILLSENNLTDVNQSQKDIVTHVENLSMINQLGEVIGALLETYSDQIANLLLTFSIGGSFIVFLISLAGYSKVRSISSDIQNNRKKIEEFQFQMLQDFNKHEEDIKKEIKEEVLQQIVFISDEASQKVEEHAYRRINYKINKLTNEIQERRFSYQKIIYKVNQAKKLEYEIVLKSGKTIDEKLEQITIIQAKYNEINNQDIPKLFSKNFRERVVPSAKKLSQIKEVSHIVKKELEKLLEDKDYSLVDREEIKEVLEDCYNWKEEKKEN